MAWPKARFLTLMALGTVPLCGAASGQSVLFTTMDPTNGISQTMHYPVTTTVESRLGFAFSSQTGGHVTQITIGLYRSGSMGPATLELYADSGGLPGAMLGAWPTSVPVYTGIPLPPVTQVVIAGGPTLQPGAMYYLVVPVQPGDYYLWFLPASGQTTPLATQVWVAPGGGPWLIDTQRYAAFALAGEPGCYANCDGSTATPILNVNDFTCYLNRYAAGEASANCDGSTLAPVLNVNDFTCFLNKFAAGCP